MMTDTVHSDLAIPPGEYLEEVIAELAMTKNELAQRMNRPAPKLSAIFSGEKAITPDTAIQLEKVVGVPAHIWTGLEAEYRLILARQAKIEEVQRSKEETDLIKKYCYSKLVELKYVSKKIKSVDKVQELQRFYGVTSLKNISRLRRYQIAFRHGENDQGERSPEALAAWLRIGELEGQKATCSPFSKKALKNLLPIFRDMTRRRPDEFEPELIDKLASVGVVIVFCPPFPRNNVYGATFWLGSNKAILMLTIKGWWADIFWFSLFHELGHLLLHGKHTVFLEESNKDKREEGLEKEAEKFASDNLVLPREYSEFVSDNSFHAHDIEKFSSRIGIHPGIVVGRLQRDGYLKSSRYNDLRQRYKWS